ncbi:MAG: M14 family zinc carboxypeptidase [Acidobacteriota bacterium]
MMRGSMAAISGGVLGILLAAGAAAGPAHGAPRGGDERLEYTRDFFPGATYDPSVPTPRSILGFPVGKRTATPEQIERCLKAWDRASTRTRLVEYARSHEGRALYYMIVTSPGNLSRADAIRRDVARLADPRGLSAAEGERLVESVPAVAWLAYSIHGDESSGADASLALIYHLAASTGDEVTGLLEDVVVLIDPMMNPDGRARFVKQVAEHRGAMPNLDDQSLLHSQYWPTGRMNHYLFDLNRDWAYGVHPETRGRIRAAGSWHPQFFVDAHEMGPQESYLFSPSRDPLNPHFPPEPYRWSARFARDQAAAFDRHGWTYYHGEWADEWYVGYSTSWAWARGAVGTLYEQAGIAEDAVRRPGGGLLTYREAVHHQVVSSMTNLRTLRANAREIKRDFLALRRRAVSESGPFARRSWAVLPTANGWRMGRFLDLMALQGIEVYRAEREFVASTAIDQLGRTLRRRTIPKGTVLIPNRQPEAHLLAAMLDFDPRMPDETLVRERQEILREGRSRMYDVTGWSLTMMFGLEALELPTGLPAGAARFEGRPERRPAAIDEDGDVVAYVLDGADDASVAAAARLMERGVQVRVADREFNFDGRSYARGSVLVTRADNPDLEGGALEALRRVATELDLEAAAATSGLGEGDLPDIGGRHFIRLEPPRIALLARGGISEYDFGAIWFALDRRLGIRHSHLSEDALSSVDLRRYNVLVLPDRRLGEIRQASIEAIAAWVRAGGTLIAIGGSAKELAAEKPGLSDVRLLPDVLDRLDEYELAIVREWLAATGRVPEVEAVWSHTARPGLVFPWERDGLHSRPDEKVLKKRDDWESLFMPQGAILAARVDPKHWLTFGGGDYLPVVFGGDPVLMTLPGIEAPVRLGYLVPVGADDAARPAPKGGSKRVTEARVGWAALPEGRELRLRMSGLLWPEAAHRLAHAAYVTREAVGGGQVILFASPPAFRGAALGTARILSNALIYGPGLGASEPIEP